MDKNSKLDLNINEEIKLKDGRSAVVRYVGKLHWESGIWVGIELNEGFGDHDGKVDGHRYYRCQEGAKTGLFVTRSMIVKDRGKKKASPGTPKTYSFNVEFSSKPLGFSLYRDESSGRFIVREVFDKRGRGEAIQPGDLLQAMNARRIFPENFSETLQAIQTYDFATPLILAFVRPRGVAPAAMVKEGSNSSHKSSRSLRRENSLRSSQRRKNRPEQYDRVPASKPQKPKVIEPPIAKVHASPVISPSPIVKVSKKRHYNQRDMQDNVSLTHSMSQHRSASAQRKKRRHLGRLHRGACVSLKEGGVGIVRHYEQGKGEGGKERIGVEILEGKDVGTEKFVEKKDLMKVYTPEDLFKTTVHLNQALRYCKRKLQDREERCAHLASKLSEVSETNATLKSIGQEYREKLTNRLSQVHTCMLEVRDTFETLDFSNPDMIDTSKEVLQNHIHIVEKDVNNVFNDMNQWNSESYRSIRELQRPSPHTLADQYFSKNLENGWYTEPQDYLVAEPNCGLSIDEISTLYRKYEKHFHKLKFTSGHSDIVYTLDCNCSNMFASGSDDQTIRFHRIVDNEVKCIRAEKQSHSVNKVVFSPCGTYIAVATAGCSVELYSVLEWKHQNTFKSKQEIWALDWSPDSKFIVVGNLGAVVEVFSLDNPNPVQILVGHTQWVNGVAYTPDGTIIGSCSGDTTLRLWRNDRCASVLQGHKHFVRSILFCPLTPTLISGSDDKTIRFWNYENPEAPFCYRILKGHSAGVSSLCLSRTGLLISAGKDGVLKIWKQETGYCVSTFKGHKGDVNDCSVSKDDSFCVSVGDDSTIKIWSLVSLNR